MAGTSKSKRGGSKQKSQHKQRGPRKVSLPLKSQPGDSPGATIDGTRLPNASGVSEPSRREAVRGANENLTHGLAYTWKVFKIVLRWSYSAGLRVVPSAIAFQLLIGFLQKNPDFMTLALVATLLLAFLGSTVLVFNAAEQSLDPPVTDVSEGRVWKDLRHAMNRVIKEELRLAGDLVGRWTVIALLVAVALALVNGLYTAGWSNGLDLGSLRSGYLDGALIVGPVMGVGSWIFHLSAENGVRFSARQDFHFLSSHAAAEQGARTFARWSLTIIQAAIAVSLAALIVQPSLG